VLAEPGFFHGKTGARLVVVGPINLAVGPDGVDKRAVERGRVRFQDVASTGSKSRCGSTTRSR